jgi:DNA-binding transcriptional LysR family regulator
MKHLRTLGFIADVAQSGSIRRTAERLNITPSALTRQIQEFEGQLGTPIFERLPQGMRLNSAGELVVQHVRTQAADFERVRSQIAALQGVRRGHVSIGCSQAFLHDELPDEIRAYREMHPLVGFTVLARDHAHAIRALIAYEVELVLVLAPPPAQELRPILAFRLPLCAMMAADHPLAGPGPVRLRDCLRYKIAMPDRSLAVRHILDAALSRTSTSADVAVESGSLEFLRTYVQREQVISFQVTSGIPAQETGLHAREVDRRDVAAMQAVLGHLHGRTLSIAAAKFADQLAAKLYRYAASDLPADGSAGLVQDGPSA